MLPPVRGQTGSDWSGSSLFLIGSVFPTEPRTGCCQISAGSTDRAGPVLTGSGAMRLLHPQFRSHARYHAIAMPSISVPCICHRSTSSSLELHVFFLPPQHVSTIVQTVKHCTSHTLEAVSFVGLALGELTYGLRTSFNC